MKRDIILSYSLLLTNLNLHDAKEKIVKGVDLIHPGFFFFEELFFAPLLSPPPLPDSSASAAADISLRTSVSEANELRRRGGAE